MAAALGDLPTDDDAWAFEPKWDGMRVRAEVDGGVVRLLSRTDRDVTVELPELVAPIAAVAPCVVLDGEVIALDDAGRPSFGRLQQRFGVTDPAEAAARAARVPATFVAFDLLHLDGIDVWTLPYSRRRALLEELVAPGPRLLVTPASVGGGAEWLATAAERGMEGVVAKRLDRPYEPGRRSGAWRKIKLRQTQEFAVCGWLPGKGNRRGGVGSLVLGCRDADGWRWVGNAGTGLADADLRWWTEALAATVRPDGRSPFTSPPRHPALRDAVWVTPTHAVQVAFGEWTSEGRLRHPAILGRRTDVEVDAIRCVDEVSGRDPLSR